MANTETERHTILVVDDQRDMVLAIRLFLEGEGHEVWEAYDGLQALEVLESKRPDLVVLDVMMPRLDGWETLKRMQEDDSLANIPVLMLTALRDAGHVAQGIDLGCTWYYTKPITDFSDFGLVIGRILSGLEPPPEPL
jgi:CheY-like chemotaxis protein